MMRVWIVLAALSFAASASAENVLMKSNGLGAAAVGVIGVTAGAAALSDPPAWQGFPKGGDGPQFSNDAPRGTASDCAAADGENLANALKDEPAEEPAKPDNELHGQISLSEA